MHPDITLLRLLGFEKGVHASSVYHACIFGKNIALVDKRSEIIKVNKSLNIPEDHHVSLEKISYNQITRFVNFLNKENE